MCVSFTWAPTLSALRAATFGRSRLNNHLLLGLHPHVLCLYNQRTWLLILSATAKPLPHPPPPRVLLLPRPLVCHRHYQVDVVELWEDHYQQLCQYSDPRESCCSYFVFRRIGFVQTTNKEEHPSVLRRNDYRCRPFYILQKINRVLANCAARQVDQ